MFNTLLVSLLLAGMSAGKDTLPLAKRTPYATFVVTKETVFAIAISPDGKTLACGCGKDLLSPSGEVQLWDLATRKQRKVFKGHTGGVRCVAFSDGGKTLISGSYDKTVKVWDVETGKLWTTLRGSVVQSPIASVAVTSDGKLMAMGNWILHLFEMSGGHERASFIWTKGVHHDWITSVAFSPDDTLLAATGWEGTVKLWDVRHAKDSNEADDALARLRKTKKWDDRTAKLYRTLDGPVAQAWSVAFAPDGKTVAATYEDGAVVLWDPSTGKERATYRHDVAAKTLAFSPVDSTLGVGYADGTIALWDAALGKRHTRFQAHASSVNAIVFAPDGKTFSSAGGGEVKLWNQVAD